jgi:CHASE3 domain sensor protein
MRWVFVIAGIVCAVIATIIAISLPDLIQQGNEIKELQQKINNTDFFKTAEFILPVVYGSRS